MQADGYCAITLIVMVEIFYPRVIIIVCVDVSLNYLSLLMAIVLQNYLRQQKAKVKLVQGVLSFPIVNSECVRQIIDYPRTFCDTVS